MRIALLGAGGPAGLNTLRALHVAGHDVVAIDENPAHLLWCEHYTETRTERDVADVDLVLAQPDELVLWLADQDLPTFQPPKTTIQRCQDKFFAARSWYQAQLRAHSPLPLSGSSPDYLHAARDVLGLPFWLRATHGAGARGAIKVSSLDQAFHWIRFWESRGADIKWMAEEFLPGRDLAWSSVWYQGVLVTSFTRERLEYLYPHLTPEGLTGTPTIARAVHSQDANERAEAAVRAIDPDPHGIFCVDLREDADGIPRPTEINAGRGFTTLGLWSLQGVNFYDWAVRLATNGWEDEAPPVYDAFPEGLTLSRHIDCEAVFTRERVAA